MKVKVSFKSKLLKPLEKLHNVFKSKLKRTSITRASCFCTYHGEDRKVPPRNRVKNLLSFFRSAKFPKQNEQPSEFHNVPNAESESSLFQPPITSLNKGGTKEASSQEDAEDACRTFENYLVEKIVEDDKVKDLMDVEELLYYWKHWKCPVFLELVSRFYGELCKDLFSSSHDGSNVDSPTTSSQ